MLSLVDHPPAAQPPLECPLCDGVAGDVEGLVLHLAEDRPHSRRPTPQPKEEPSFWWSER